MNRDPKKQRKPYSTEDFCTFIDRSSNKPALAASTAFMALAEAKKLPSWALGFFSDFKGGEKTKRPWDELAMVGENFILLAPVEIHEGFEGTMIAEHECSGKEIQVVHAGGTWLIKVPEFNDFLYAEAGATVDVLRPPDPIAPDR